MLLCSLRQFKILVQTILVGIRWDMYTLLVFLNGIFLGVCLGVAAAYFKGHRKWFFDSHSEEIPENGDDVDVIDVNGQSQAFVIKKVFDFDSNRYALLEPKQFVVGFEDTLIVKIVDNRINFIQDENEFHRVIDFIEGDSGETSIV